MVLYFKISILFERENSITKTRGAKREKEELLDPKHMGMKFHSFDHQSNLQLYQGSRAMGKIGQKPHTGNLYVINHFGCKVRNKQAGMLHLPRLSVDKAAENHILV